MTVCCMHQARRNEFELRDLKVLPRFLDVMGREAYRFRDPGGRIPPEKFEILDAF